ncbi:hypothetical protein HGRIS_010925 [Hohenbuehelia grisea]|uniref:LysM domain-containing protein n=1 Tax=Hohenbuehelia grisea TaxID=104357 RepID=A0ABR3IYI9_9AGAR
MILKTLLAFTGILAYVSFTNAACTQTYTVVSGDSCSAIPQKNSISTHQLNKLNPNLNCNTLFVGQQLCVVDSAYNCQPVYTVKSGDSCWDIANTRGTTVDTLIANNPEVGSGCGSLQIGQVLCVANTVVVDTPLSSPTCTSSYIVKSGDNCNAIASSNGISSYQLSVLNPSMTCSGLFIGQSLCLRGSAYSCSPVHTVVSGDTCFDIAAAASITVAQLLADNPQLTPDCPISIGLTLCVSLTTPGSTPTSSSTTSTSPTPTPTACTRFTTVQDGETCNSIGARTGTSLYWIHQLNPTLDPACSNLISGSAVCVNSEIVNCNSIYQVKGTEGGCTGIANTLQIPLQTLLDLNPNVFANCTNLQIDEVLCTSPRTSTPPNTACTRTYTIVPGDTCPIIASRNSITSAQLVALNPGMSCSTLQAGNTLCSYSPSLSICPNLVVVSGGDSCFSLAQNVSMSLQEWQSINVGLSCDPLWIGSIACSAQGNATLPQAPSGTNPTSLPLCGNYDKTKYCCSKFSVSAALFDDPLCERANGCQDNCIGDSGVTKPAQSPTPTFTLTPTLYPTPPPPPNECNNCTATQCCGLTGLCVEGLSSFYCKSANGCTKNCDQGVPDGHFDLPGQQGSDEPNFTFPDGDYSSSNGNPCGGCNSDKAGATSPSGQYCCTSDVRCAPQASDRDVAVSTCHSCLIQEFPACKVFAGCLYNCIDYILQDATDCEMLGECDYVTTTILQPFATST